VPPRFAPALAPFVVPPRPLALAPFGFALALVPFAPALFALPPPPALALAPRVLIVFVLALPPASSPPFFLVPLALALPLPPPFPPVPALFLVFSPLVSSPFHLRSPLPSPTAKCTSGPHLLAAPRAFLAFLFAPPTSWPAERSP